MAVTNLFTDQGQLAPTPRPKTTKGGVVNLFADYKPTSQSAKPASTIVQTSKAPIIGKVLDLAKSEPVKSVVASAKSIFENIKKAVAKVGEYKAKGENINAPIGRAMQKVPNVDLGTKTKNKFSVAPSVEEKIVNFVSNFPSAMIQGYGKSLEQVSSDKGRAQLKTDAKNLPKTMSEVKTLIEKKEWQKALETAMSNTAFTVALDASDFISVGLIAKGVKAIRAIKASEKQLAKTIVKEAIQEAEEQVVKNVDTIVKPKTVVKPEVKPDVTKGRLPTLGKDIEVFHGGNAKNADSIKNNFRILSPEEQAKYPTTVVGDIQMGLSTSTKKDMADYFASLHPTGQGATTSLKLSKNAKVYDLPKNIDSIDSLGLKRLQELKAQGYEVIRDVSNTGGENEIRIISENALVKPTQGAQGRLYDPKKPFSSVTPETFTPQNIAKSLDETGHSPLNDVYFHVGSDKSIGSEKTVWMNKGQPFKHGQIFAIDKTKLDPSKIIKDMKTGYERYTGKIPQDAYIYIGEWKPGERMNNNVLAEKMRSALSPSTPPSTGGEINRYLESKIPELKGSGANIEAVVRGDTIAIDNLFLDKKGTGLGTKIVKELQNYADQQGKFLQVNKAYNKGFWSKFGFDDIGGEALRRDPRPISSGGEIGGVTTKAQTPIQPKTSGVAKQIESKAVEKGMVDKGYSELAQYDSSTIKAQSKAASKYTIDDMNKIATGEKPLPKELKPGTPLSIAEDYAIKNKDTELLRKLANSPLAKQISESASELSLSRMRDTNSPVKIMRDIAKVKEEAFKKRYAGKSVKEVSDKVVSDIKKKVKPVDKYDWGNFVKSLPTC